MFSLPSMRARPRRGRTCEGARIKCSNVPAIVIFLAVRACSPRHLGVEGVLFASKSARPEMKKRRSGGISEARC